MDSDMLQHMNASSEDLNLQNFTSGSSVDGPLPFDIAKQNFTGTVRFVNEVNQRGTVSLLISCCITLGLCAYSIVRLNISPKGNRRFGEVFKWWIIALFAPEVILYTALKQLTAARQLRDEVRQAKENVKPRSFLDENTTPGSKEHHYQSSKHSSWTIVHSFYATMGGFAIDLDCTEGNQSQLFGDVRRLTLTSKGVVLFAQCGHLPDMPVNDIKNKCQASGVAKSLVCIQAGWMIMQVITRAAVSLPISLLELYTVAHAVLTLATYVVWWYKPRHVARPTLMRSENIQSLVMYMYLASRMSGDQPAGRFGRFMNPKAELQKLAYLEADDQISVQNEAQPALQPLEADFSIAPGHFVPPPWDHSQHDQEPSSPMPADDTKLAQRRLAADAVSVYSTLRSRFSLPESPSVSKLATYLTPYTSELVQSHSPNWPNAGLLTHPQSHLVGLVLCAVVTTYGGIHVSAWDTFFPTNIEQLFWHLSSAWITFFAALWLLANLLIHLIPPMNRIWVACSKRKVGWLGKGVITVLYILCGTSYIVSRAFLLVEAFVSIREVPRDLYRTPAWTQALPHL